MCRFAMQDDDDCDDEVAFSNTERIAGRDFSSDQMKGCFWLQFPDVISMFLHTWRTSFMCFTGYKKNSFQVGAILGTLALMQLQARSSRACNVEFVYFLCEFLTYLSFLCKIAGGFFCSIISKLFSRGMHKDTLVEVSQSHEFYENFDGNHIKGQHQLTNQLSNFFSPTRLVGNMIHCEFTPSWPPFHEVSFISLSAS